MSIQNKNKLHKNDTLGMSTLSKHSLHISMYRSKLKLKQDKNLDSSKIYTTEGNNPDPFRPSYYDAGLISSNL